MSAAFTTGTTAKETSRKITLNTDEDLDALLPKHVLMALKTAFQERYSLDWNVHAAPSPSIGRLFRGVEAKVPAVHSLCKGLVRDACHVPKSTQV